MIAGPEHAEVLGQLLHDFNTEFGSPTPSAEALAARFAVLLGREDQVALMAGPAAGFAYLTLRLSPYHDGPTALLEELYVVPHLRGQGIGTALLTETVEVVRARGAQEMQVNVDEVDLDARRFYERHGFTNEGDDGRMLFYERVWDLG